MSILSPLGRQFFELGKVEDCPVYDMHGHMGPFYGIYMPGADPASAVHSMDRAGVRMLVFCHHGALFSSTGNLNNIEAVRQFPNRLRAYCGINPNYPEAAEKDVASFDEYRDVYVGFKFLADYHKRKLSDDCYRPALEKADADGLLVLLHTWSGSAYNGYPEVCKVAEKYPNARFVLGHSIFGNWDDTVDAARRFPNTYLDLCALMNESPGILEKLVREAGSERITFGTDYPWFDFHYYIGAILGADISDEDRRNIFYRNAQKLLEGVGVQTDAQGEET